MRDVKLYSAGFRQKSTIALAASAFALAMLAAGPAGAISLTVNNPSFETGAPGVYSTTPPTFYPAIGWRFGCANPSACGTSGIVAIGFAPNGSQAGFTSNGGQTGIGANAFIAQEIDPIVPGAQYTLSVMVGHMPDTNLANYRLILGYNATPHDPNTNVQFLAVDFSGASIPAGEFILASITGIAPLEAAGGWLTIALASGTFALWDQVSVTQTPLPAALPLFATVLAGGGLIAWRRKRKAAVAATR